jgi:hypothetical protein
MITKYVEPPFQTLPFHEGPFVFMPEARTDK